MGDVRIGTCRICGNGLISGSASSVCPACESRVQTLSFKREIAYDEALKIIEGEGLRAGNDGDFDWDAALGPQMTDDELKHSTRTAGGRLGSRSVPALDLGSYTDDQFIDDANRLRKKALKDAGVQVGDEYVKPSGVKDGLEDLQRLPQIPTKMWVCPSCEAQLTDEVLRDSGIIEGDMKPICPRCGNVMEWRK